MNTPGKTMRREFEYHGYFVRVEVTPLGYTALVFDDVTDPALTLIKAPQDERGMGSITAQAKEFIDLQIKKKTGPKPR